MNEIEEVVDALCVKMCCGKVMEKFMLILSEYKTKLIRFIH